MAGNDVFTVKGFAMRILSMLYTGVALAPIFTISWKTNVLVLLLLISFGTLLGHVNRYRSKKAWPKLTCGTEDIQNDAAEDAQNCFSP
jgi:hypothetical protein